MKFVSLVVCQNNKVEYLKTFIVNVPTFSDEINYELVNVSREAFYQKCLDFAFGGPEVVNGMDNYFIRIGDRTVALVESE